VVGCCFVGRGWKGCGVEVWVWCMCGEKGMKRGLSVYAAYGVAVVCVVGGLGC
jgi:hypothetical protein